MGPPSSHWSPDGNAETKAGARTVEPSAVGNIPAEGKPTIVGRTRFTVWIVL